LTTRPQQRNAITTAVSQPLCLRATDSPADGYYEWQRTPAGGKTPHFLRPRDRGVLAFAGLYELWCDPTLPPADPTAWLWTTTILTTAAILRLAHLHDRMPVIVAPARYAAWLDPGLTDPAAVRGLLTPTRPDLLEAYPVDAAVGNVANNGPQLTDPARTPASGR
jgi:putative SOS response-associated peptidase YedK